MKKLLATAALLAAPLFSHAYTTTTWQDTIDFNPNPKINTHKSYTFTHDLTDNGFNPTYDLIKDYSLTIKVYDNEKWDLDIVIIDQPGKGWFEGGGFVWKTTSIKTGDTYEGLLSLNDDGKLKVTISSLWGEFFLDSSYLKATGKDNPNGGGGVPVPEPSSVALLAAGLLGIVVMRRAARTKN